MNRNKLPLILGTLALLGTSALSLRSSAQTDPNPAETPAARAFQASYAAEASSRFDAAVAPLDALPTAKRAAYVVSLRRGWLLYRAGKYADSVGAYGAAIAAAPDAVEPRQGQLLPLLAQRRWVDAEKAARELLSRDPGNQLALLRLGFAQYSLGRNKEAELSYARALALYPADVEARSGLAWAQLRQDKPEKLQAAIANFNDLLELAPRHPYAAEGLLTARKRLAEAR